MKPQEFAAMFPHDPRKAHDFLRVLFCIHGLEVEMWQYAQNHPGIDPKCVNMTLTTGEADPIILKKVIQYFRDQGWQVTQPPSADPERATLEFFFEG